MNCIVEAKRELYAYYIESHLTTNDRCTTNVTYHEAKYIHQVPPSVSMGIINSVHRSEAVSNFRHQQL